MPALTRRFGRGLAARGDPEDAVAWSRRARGAGLDTVWIHDPYGKLEAVTFATLVAAGIVPCPRGSARTGHCGYVARVLGTLHMAFGGLLVLGVLPSGLLRG